MHALTAPPDISPADRLSVTIFFAVLAHLILILGVTFVREDRSERRVETLDVVLVPHRSETAPDQPDYLAQTNQDGGGDDVEKVRPATPKPAPFPASEPAIVAAGLATPPFESRLVDPVIPSRSAPPAAAPEEAPAPALSRNDTTTTSEVVAAPAQVVPTEAAFVEAIPVETAPLEAVLAETAPADAFLTEAITIEAAPAEAASVEIDTATLVSRSLAIAVLTAEINRKLRAYAERPRRKWISARTREHRFAAYMDAWRRKVERIGNLNYPDEAARRGLSGNLLLDVALNPDGTVEEITLRRSSGERVLDDAAVRIVKLAAPFSKFSESIAEEVDILHIERTWVFLSTTASQAPE